MKKHGLAFRVSRGVKFGCRVEDFKAVHMHKTLDTLSHRCYIVSYCLRLHYRES